VRIAVLSDIHGNLAALEAVVADFTRRGAAIVVNLGDSVSGPLRPRATAEYLMAQGWIHLAGNHERQLLTHAPEELGLSDAYARGRLTRDALAWMAALPPALAASEELFLCHGTPTSDAAYFLETVEPTGARPATPEEIEARLGDVTSTMILCGHTHVPRSVRSARGQWIVNPGSVGLPAYTEEKPLPHTMETGSPDARYAIVERSPAGWSTQLLTVPYDHLAMARLARSRGRTDWANALATGFVGSSGEASA
jgi:predicted phosphodiesterase